MLSVVRAALAAAPVNRPRGRPRQSPSWPPPSIAIAAAKRNRNAQ